MLRTGDRVVIKNNSLLADWKALGVDLDTVGIVTFVFGSTKNVDVVWPNGKPTICRADALKQYKDENVSLPNQAFMKHKRK